MPSNYDLYKRHEIKLLALFVFDDNGVGRPNLEKLLNFFRKIDKLAKSQKALVFVIPAPHQVRDKLQRE